jgi:hypothetical protein
VIADAPLEHRRPVGTEVHAGSFAHDVEDGRHELEFDVSASDCVR